MEEELRRIEDAQHLLKRETEEYLKYLCVEEYKEREKVFWKRDYSSIEKFLLSVEPNRKRLRDMLGIFSPDPDFEVRETPFLKEDYREGKWIILKFSRNLYSRALLVFPRRIKGPYPLIIAQHGISCSPEKIFGINDPENLYKEFGNHLLREGFAVLAPLHITSPRTRFHRLALLLGKTLAGLEISKLMHILEYVVTLPFIDAERIGMWGLSLGGFYTLFSLPLISQIKAGIISAFFNHRLRKLVIDDFRYSCYLSTSEEHIFLPGWLREFRDSDLVSLICPRPLMIQTGKADAVSWYPFVEEEFRRAREHYEKLGIGERIKWVLHEGGHEVRVEEGIEFLKTWLVDKKI